ncbi:hypothetical protein IID23_00640 [Patescibacteria group bacterium]|nr:hypothetical protein [Patescibacteria group bacterium]
MIQEVTNASLQALNDALVNTANFLPNLIAATLIFIIGVILAVLVKNALTRVLEAIRLEKLLSKTVIPEALKSVGTGVTTTSLLGELVRWFLIIIFLIPAIDQLGLGAANEVLTAILLYIPNVVVAVIIIAVGAVLAKIARDLITVTAASLGTQAAGVIGQVGRWAILIFSILAALNQLGVATDLIRILFTGLVAMFAIAGGLAFGLGGRETAEMILKKLRREMIQDQD